MFENLLGQEGVAAQLRRDILARELPSSLLFSGPPASGKLTAALELARVLSCQVEGPAKAAWNCACPACHRHRVLAHPDLLILGPRTFPEEIPAGLDLLRRSPGRASAYFFVRSVRKLQKRFDAALYEGEETRLAKASALLRELEERLDLVRPDDFQGEVLSEAALDAAGEATETARKLEAFVPDTVPVFQVRAAGYWTRMAPSGNMKTIVIEGADHMLDASRNALLKILEEPPASLEFVLLSSRPSALMATTLSRLRPYTFRSRGFQGEAAVLERVFKLGRPEIDSLVPPRGQRTDGAIEAWLAGKRPFGQAQARRLALSFLGAVGARQALQAGLDPAIAAMPELLEDLSFGTSPEAAGELGDLALADLGQATKDFGAKDDAYASSFDEFLGALSILLSAILRLPGLGPSGFLLVEAWAALIREAKTRAEIYNLNPGLLAESLLYSMGRARP